MDARVDDNTVNHIYVRLDEKQPFTKCHLSSRNVMLKDIPVSEAEFIQDHWVTFRENACYSRIDRHEETACSI